MKILISLIGILFFLSCEKDAEELSKARMIWGTWNVEETKTIHYNPNGMVLSETVQNFDIQFNHSSDGFIKSVPYVKILWAIQDDPEKLIISKEVADFNGTKIYKTDLFAIGDCTAERITLHNQFITRNDSLDITTIRRWDMSPE